MCVTVLPTTTNTYIAVSQTEAFTPLTEWMPSTGINLADFALVLRNASTNFKVRLAVQYAKVRPNAPEEADGVGTAIKEQQHTSRSSSTTNLQSFQPSPMRNSWRPHGHY